MALEPTPTRHRALEILDRTRTSVLVLGFCAFSAYYLLGPLPPPEKERLRTFAGTFEQTTRHPGSRSSGPYYTLALKGADGAATDFNIQDWATPLIEHRLKTLTKTTPVTVIYDTTWLGDSFFVYELRASGQTALRYEDAVRAKNAAAQHHLKYVKYLLLGIAAILIWTFFSSGLPALRRHFRNR